MKKVIKAKSIYPNHDENSIIYVDNGIIERITDKLPATYEMTDYEFIDLSKYHLYPSFNDSHMHLIGYGASLSQCILDGVKSLSQLQQILSDYITIHQPSVVVGRGWNQDLFDSVKFPNRFDLDVVSTDRPVILYRTCGHIAVVNSYALHYFNINADTKIEGGEIELENTIPTGILRENALSLVRQDPSISDMEHYILKAQSRLHQYGITSVQTDDLIMVDAKDQFKILDLFKKLDQNGLLKLRVYEQSQFFTPEDFVSHINSGYQQNQGSIFFKTGPLKILADGSLGSRTAKLRAPYRDATDTQGILIHNENELKNLISIAMDNHIDVAIHGIGDYTINWIIEHLSNTDRSSAPQNRRDAIIHCQIMDRLMIKTMGQSGIHALVQPVFLEYDMNIVEQRVGSELARFSYAYRTMIENNIILAFGSDAPVEDPNPFRGLYYAIYRKNPSGKVFYSEECLDFNTAFDAYTKAGAYFSYEAHFKGELKNGYLADFIAIPNLLETLEADDLLNVKVAKTYVGGNCVYSK